MYKFDFGHKAAIIEPLQYIDKTLISVKFVYHSIGDCFPYYFQLLHSFFFYIPSKLNILFPIKLTEYIFVCKQFAYD